jgi:hypothetical protein
LHIFVNTIFFDNTIRSIQLACSIFAYLLRRTAASSINGQRNVDEPSSHAPEENWSTGVSKDSGHPSSPYYCPAECDTTLQQQDRWFWGQRPRLKSIEEMIDIYSTPLAETVSLN